ncbi:ABC transporter permease [Calidithermus roseus]|uniref:Sulfate transport system permease protein CysT n=1 Tax=Calidithermus roseus TaxID=1644118 RepID=A0A399EG44_9DEIN|nr:iron ABC transporter permease [Calidithermus roseus]RIH83617.1 Sulfate transport system permease protein CysT [Calidithermus roseus]
MATLRRPHAPPSTTRGPLLLALLAWGVLPWQAGSGWPLALQAGPWAWAVGLTQVLALALAIAPGARRARAVRVAAVTATAFILLAGGLALAGWTLGPGMVVVGFALVFALGYALAEAGRFRDPLLGALILSSALLIFLFIIYPLLGMARAVTLERLLGVLRDSRFLMLENPFTPQPETLRALLVAVVVALVGARLDRARRLRGLLVGLAVGVALGVALFGRGALASSLLVAGVVAPLSTLLGLAFAILQQRTRLRWLQPLLGGLALLPLITPPFVLAFALILMFGRNGFVSANLLGLDSNFLFGPVGLITAQVLAFAPVAFLVLRGSVQGLNASLEEAAWSLGSSRWRVFRTVTWPLLRPGLANALLLAVIESLSDFGNPLILGGDRNYLATEVFIAFTGRYDPVEAAVYGLVLLGLVLLVFWLQYRWLGQTSFVTTTGKPSGGRPLSLPGALEVALTALLAVWGLLVVSLYGSVIVGSFVQLWGFNYTPTLKHYQDFLVLGLPVFANTFKIALIAAIPTAILGFVLAYLVFRQEFAGKRLLEFSALLSFAMPGTVMGVGYVLAFNAEPWVLTGTTVIIILALIFREVPVGIRAGVAGLAQIEPALEEASATLGSSTGRTLSRVVLPLLLPAFIGGLAFAFVRGMTAVSQIIFLVGPGNLLATVLLLGWVEQGQMGRAAAMSTVMILSLLAVVLLLFPLTRRFDVRLGGGV